MKRKIISIFITCLVILFFMAIVFNFVICPKKYKNYVSIYSQEYGLEMALVYAVIKVESDFDNRAVSRSGALGLMQILPSTASWIAESLGEDYVKDKMFVAKTNIKYGCFYLRYLFDKFKDIDIVICAYNAGEGKVIDWVEDGRLYEDKIDYGETKRYLLKVREYYSIYKNDMISA